MSIDGGWLKGTTQVVTWGMVQIYESCNNICMPGMAVREQVFVEVQKIAIKTLEHQRKTCGFFLQFLQNMAKNQTLFHFLTSVASTQAGRVA